MILAGAHTAAEGTPLWVWGLILLVILLFLGGVMSVTVLQRRRDKKHPKASPTSISTLPYRNGTVGVVPPEQLIPDPLSERKER